MGGSKEVTLELVSALQECETYLDSIADADHDETGFVPNKEMQLLVQVKRALDLWEGNS
ncbi:hypothetical protein [Microcystis phage Mae-JY35]